MVIYLQLIVRPLLVLNGLQLLLACQTSQETQENISQPMAPLLRGAL